MEKDVTGSTILFDGVCNLCNGWVDFVIRRDPAGKFQFASLQSEPARKILSERGLSADELAGLYLVEGNRIHFKSGAVLRILKNLGHLWPLLSIFLIVPSSLRDWVYDIVARNRYRWFGRQDTCRLPSVDEKRRFLE